MNPSFWPQLQQPARISWKTAIGIILPTLIWLGGIQSRSVFIRPPCAVPTEAQIHCAIASVNSLDRTGMGVNRGDADLWSNRGQISAMIITLSVPIVFNLAQRMSPALAVVAIGEDLAVLLQTVAWNGVFTEVVRLAAARPRPFVYADPAAQGQDPAHYVSFYSGHTSFVAACLFGLLFVLFARSAGPGWILTVGLSMQCVLMVTAFGRVLSDRHFITDTLAATVAGALVAFGVAWICRRTANDRRHLDGKPL